MVITPCHQILILRARLSIMKIQCYVLNHWFHLMCMKCHIALVYQLANQESYRHCRDVMASETTAKWIIVQQLVQANKQKTSMLHITKPLWGEVIIMMTSPWWRHQMEIFSALLAICAGNSPVPGEFPTQRPVTWSFDVYFDLRPNKRLSKQS